MSDNATRVASIPLNGGRKIQEAEGVHLLQGSRGGGRSEARPDLRVILKLPDASEARG